MSECLLEKAKAIVSSADSVTYSSGASANYVRRIMRELITVIEEKNQVHLFTPHPMLPAETQIGTEVCGLCLGDGKCPECNGTGALPTSESSCI